jgi:nucleosome assembly protein 1-like 1
MEALENEDVDEAELEELDERLEVDYQLGEDFKEKIIPRAVDYFTGKALQYDEDFDEEYDDDEDYSDDEVRWRDRMVHEMLTGTGR